MEAHKVVLWEGRREKKEMAGWVIVKERSMTCKANAISFSTSGQHKPETFQF
jgi:hypothetical protein